MEPLVTARAMRQCDRFAVAGLKLPALVLMENAGAGAAGIITSRFGPPAGRSFTLFCGKGNNGGDGFVVARHLWNAGARVLVVLLAKRAELRKEARVNYECLRKLRTTGGGKSMLRLEEVSTARALGLLPKSEFAVDAIFGTGFSGKVRGVAAQAISAMNSGRGTTISLDIPSGVDADSGEVGNVAVRASLTITMGLKKIGLVVGKGRGYAGQVEVVPIGIRGSDLLRAPAGAYLVGAEDAAAALPVRPFDAHKHSVGKVFVLAGSRGLTGAAAMTCTAAMRTGAGAVILGTPASVSPVLSRKLTEVMVDPLPETAGGTLSMAAVEAARRHIRWADVVILGPGLSRDPETGRFIRELIDGCEKPMLIDADGLNGVAEEVTLLKRRGNRETIITPHTGEFSRLTGMASAEIERTRSRAAGELARRLSLTVVLKGAPTLTASEEGPLYVNSNGNPGMATAGSGDILSGVIGALWAQGLGRAEAAFCGVFVHGRAGDLSRDELGEKGMMAMDICRNVPRALLELEGPVQG